MCGRVSILLALLTMLANAGTGCEVCAQAIRNRPTEAVTVAIRPVFEVKSPVVLLSDIARIDSSDTDLKAQIEMLDIADAPDSGESTIVTPSLVEFRLRLAGIDLRRASIHGVGCKVKSGRVGIQIPSALGDSGQIRPLVTDEMILARATKSSNARLNPSSSRDDAASSMMPRRQTEIRTSANETRSTEELVILSGRQCIMEHLPWKEDDVTIRVVQPIGREIQATEPARGLILTAERHGTGPPVGRVQVNVTIERADHSSHVVPVTFDVRHFDNVVAATRPIPKGREIQQDDVYIHRADVTDSSDYCSDPRKFVGATTRRVIAALQIVRDQDVEAGAAASGKGAPIVIKRQDRVKMIARIGDLNITVSGEAQQDGRIGEMIRIQNVESKAIVQARVVRANEVEIVE